MFCEFNCFVCLLVLLFVLKAHSLEILKTKKKRLKAFFTILQHMGINYLACVKNNPQKYQFDSITKRSKIAFWYRTCFDMVITVIITFLGFYDWNQNVKHRLTNTFTVKHGKSNCKFIHDSNSIFDHCCFSSTFRVFHLFGTF